jgi:trimeric autotransporter adhesin
MNKVTDISQMLRGCPNYNKDDAKLFVMNNVTNTTSFMLGVTLSSTNYDAILIAWAAQTLKPNLVVSFGASKYTTAGQTAKNHIISTYNWTFADGGLE